MENASKALIMAGSVLIALIVISVLVFFFSHLSEWQRIEESGTQVEQATEFNKQYEVYQRNTYGSELLSLANKIADYNLREADKKGYTKIELSVQFTNDMDSKYFKKGTYNASKLKQEAENLEEETKTIGAKSIKSRTNSSISRKIGQLASMRTNDIEQLGIDRSDYQTLVTQYNTYKTLLTEVKAKVFQCVSFEYDQNTGRIIKMNYKQ